MRAPVRVVELQVVGQSAVKIGYSLVLDRQPVHFRLNIQLVFGSLVFASQHLVAVEP